MYFCPKCNYSFDIKKSSNKREKIDIDNALILVKTDDLNNYIADFSKEDLEKNKKYKKLKKDQKKEINKLFTKTFFGEAEFNCVNCNYSEVINKSIRLYQINFKNTEEESYIEKNKILVKNPILARTKDYTCKNINCITHKDPTNKEAVYMRSDNNYNLKYICCVCYNDWTLN